jgi:hypothetical protein
MRTEKINKEAPRIWYPSPYSITRNIGGAINAEAIGKELNDWLCIRDGDSMFLTPQWGKVIAEAVEKYGDKYQLIGCMTNRLNDRHQLHNGIFSDDPDIRNHMHIAKQREREYGSTVIDCPGDVAGVFMLFQVRTLLALPFIENDIYFDRKFCETLRYNGMKLGIMPGLYIFHLYRMWSADPVRDTKHLTL